MNTNDYFYLEDNRIKTTDLLKQDAEKHAGSVEWCIGKYRLLSQFIDEQGNDELTYVPTVPSCALCKKYYNNNCEGCPIYESTNKDGCQDTPFDTMDNHHFTPNLFNLETITLKSLVEDGIKFLEGLGEI